MAELNEGNLVDKVAALAEGQPSGWEGEALRILAKEEALVQRDFFQKSDKAAIVFLDGLMTRWMFAFVHTWQCVHSVTRLHVCPAVQGSSQPA
jgi:hypothetical protein